MKITIQTATVTLGKRETLLTRAIVRQIPMMPTPSRYTVQDFEKGICSLVCQCVVDQWWIIVSTPDGLFREHHYPMIALASKLGVTVPHIQLIK